MIDALSDNRERGLDFFVNCDAVCMEIREHHKRCKGEAAMQGMQDALLRDVEFLHNMPLQTLNDRLKRYAFVDPTPFDELLTEMMTAILEWVEWVCEPDWIAEVLHSIGEFLAKHNKNKTGVATASDGVLDGQLELLPGETGEELESRREDLDELEELGKFIYPMPLRLRDLQFMVRPFMEVRSHHYIMGLDAVVAELVKDLLRLYYTIKAWDEMLVQYIKQLAEANLENTEVATMKLCEMCACMELDIFEAAHRLHHIDPQKYGISKGDIEMICQKLPIFSDKVVLRGPPVATFSRSEHLQQMISGTTRAPDSPEPGADISSVEQIRIQALRWWRQQRFGHAVATNIFTSSFLAYLMDSGLHPDPYVADHLPLVMETLFSCNLSCRVFMNKLLPKLGGYVDSRGEEVPLGHGLPLETNVGRCAESILVFLRQWVEVCQHTTYREQAGNTIRRSTGTGKCKGQVSVRSVSTSRAKRGSTFNMDSFIQELTGPKHDVHEVVNMLEGASIIPDHVLNVPVEDKRYRVDPATERLWEHMTGQHTDLHETLHTHHRDLGPYIFLDLLSEENVAPGQIMGQHQSLVNPSIAKAAKEGYKMGDDSDGSDDEVSAMTSDPNNRAGSPTESRAGALQQLSDTFGLRLVEWPRELVGSGTESSSTFVGYFSNSGRNVARDSLKGLPMLPWCFGSDQRNTIILDIPGPGVAPFHCIFTQARAQPMRPCIVALGGTLVPTHIVCPKYQPIQVQNGDRLVCHQWNFELRIVSTGLHSTALQLLTDEGDIFDVPIDGCHVGAGNRSRPVPNQPIFPPTKFALKHRLKDMSGVHMAFNYHAPSNRWTLIDHSPEPFGTLLLLKTGHAYPLSHGLRVKLGPIIFETVLNV